jgi:hypothetical protein
MGYSLSLEAKGSFLHVKVMGENTPENLQQYLAEVYKSCSERGFSAVLIEENLSGPSLLPADVYKIITRASSQTSPIVNKIAFVDVNPIHLSSIAALGEAVGRDRGVHVRIFRTVAEAAAWLTGEK